MGFLGVSPDPIGLPNLCPFAANHCRGSAGGNLFFFWLANRPGCFFVFRPGKGCERFKKKRILATCLLAMSTTRSSPMGTKSSFQELHMLDHTPEIIDMISTVGSVESIFLANFKYAPHVSGEPEKFSGCPMSPDVVRIVTASNESEVKD